MSTQKRHTAQEMREMADCIGNIRQSEMPSWKEGEIITGGDLCRSADMLRQAADAEDEMKNLVEQNEKLNAWANELLLEREQARARLEAVVKHLAKYKGTEEPDYCCADCIEDIAKEVGFSFARGEGGAE